MAKSEKFMANIGSGKTVSGERAGMPPRKKRIPARGSVARKLSLRFGDADLDGFDPETTRDLYELSLRFAEEKATGQQRPCLDDALPDYLKDPVSFIYHSGWRLSGMKALEWSDV